MFDFMCYVLMLCSILSGNILPPSDLLACLKYILDDTAPPADYPVGVLTTENRDVWAKARQHLESIGNADIFSLIDSGIFTLCFDDAEIAGDLQFLLRHFLHSDGCNRYLNADRTLKNLKCMP